MKEAQEEQVKKPWWRSKKFISACIVSGLYLLTMAVEFFGGLDTGSALDVLAGAAAAAHSAHVVSQGIVDNSLARNSVG